jgi:hypothetical protein
MSARPGLTAHHYRSLLVNAAEPLMIEGDRLAPVQEAGGGVLSLDRSLETTLAAYPTAISFGDTTTGLERRLTVTNLGPVSDTVTITTEPFEGGAVPAASETSLVIPPGEARTVTFSLFPGGQPAGEYQGFVWVRGTQPGSEMHVPYWYALPSTQPGHVNVVWSDESASPGTLLRGGIGIRVTDAAGIPLEQPIPQVSVVSGGGAVLSVFPSSSRSPALFEATIRLGSTPGENIFRVEAGGVSKVVVIEGF